MASKLMQKTIFASVAIPYITKKTLRKDDEKIYVVTTRKLDDKKKYIESKKTASSNFLYEVTETKYYKDENKGEFRQWPPYVLNHYTKEFIFNNEYKINGEITEEVFQYREQITEHMMKIVNKKDTNTNGDVKLNDAILFIHGFNVSNDDAIENAKEIQKASGKPIIVYDWASNYAKFNIFNPMKAAKMYADDFDIADNSVETLIWILIVLSFEIENLHIIAHSMGSKIAISAITDICNNYRLHASEFSRSKLDKNMMQKKFSLANDLHKQGFDYILYTQMLERIKSIVFVQPDVDIITMSRFIRKDIEGTIMHENSTKKINRIVRIYGHRYDNALRISQFVHSGIPRTGQINKKLFDDIIKTAKKKADDNHEYHVNITKDLFFGDKGIMVDAKTFCQRTWKSSKARLDNSFIFNAFNLVPWFAKISMCSNENHSYFNNPKFHDSLLNFYKSNVNN